MLFFSAVKFVVLSSAPSFIETLVTLIVLVNFEDRIEGDLVLGFLVVGFLTRLAIFSAVNFFILGIAPPFIETLVVLFGLVHFEDWIEDNSILGFSKDGCLTRLAIFLAKISLYWGVLLLS